MELSPIRFRPNKNKFRSAYLIVFFFFSTSFLCWKNMNASRLLSISPSQGEKCVILEILNLVQGSLSPNTQNTILQGCNAGLTKKYICTRNERTETAIKNELIYSSLRRKHTSVTLLTLFHISLQAPCGSQQ